MPAHDMDVDNMYLHTYRLQTGGRDAVDHPILQEPTAKLVFTAGPI